MKKENVRNSEQHMRVLLTCVGPKRKSRATWSTKCPWSLFIPGLEALSYLCCFHHQTCGVVFSIRLQLLEMMTLVWSCSADIGSRNASLSRNLSILPFFLKSSQFISGLYSPQDGERVSLSTCTPLTCAPVTLRSFRFSKYSMFS